MTGRTSWGEIKHKSPPGKKVITYQQLVIFDRWYVAFAWLHTKKKPLWQRLHFYAGRNTSD